jgi:uncharacterized protein YaaR (DUF327 family)
MDVYTLKSSIIEYLENIYGLAMNKYNKKGSVELKSLLDELNLYSKRIRECNTVDEVNNYDYLISNTLNRIEDFIYE